ncbi:hypothetical protein A3A66_04545 [Microgenomates group bacterium RIFCSPLOWO2_01_FULL_46_13]|nr:MAG: hypothetical protein A3A66_04545 [Microgenomates group bacterium RIFCSPLOWO2_01_FULL_46_13]
MSPLSDELSLLRPLIPTFFSMAEAYKPRSHRKSDTTPVTDIDKRIEELISKTILQAYPTDKILGEELSAREKMRDGRLWVVDPICGTFNLVNGIPWFNTNIALFENQRPVFALVVDYARKTYYWSTRVKSAVYEEERLLKPKLTPTIKGIVCIDVGYLQVDLNQLSDKRRTYAQMVSDIVAAGFELVSNYSSLSFTYAALGKYGSMVLTQLKPWDLAAACFLMEQNGGVVTDWGGKPWGSTTSDVVGSLDKASHQKLLGIIQEGAG